MVDEKKLLHRRKLKAKKPTFLAQDIHKKKRLEKKWKKPKGLQSKMRLQKKGHRKIVSVGWKSPKEVRGLSREGLEQVRIENLSQLENINSKTQGIIISSKLSIKKKYEILLEAEKKNITVLNRNVKALKERLELKIKAKTEKKKDKKDKESKTESKKSENKETKDKKEEKSDNEKKENKEENKEENKKVKENKE